MQVYKAIKYIRLSYTDDKTVESDSVANQRRLIDDYIARHPEIEVVAEKIDDGYSGVLFDRPAFQEMMRMIEQGEANCVIVKDLSRLGREYIETGRYMRRVFPAYHYYYCPTGKKNGCKSSVMVKESDLIECVQGSLKGHIENVASLDALLSSISQERINRELAQEYAGQIKANEKRMAQVEGFKAKLYENLVSGILTKEEFLSYKRKYNADIELLQKAVAEWNEKLTDVLENRSERNRWINHFMQFSTMEEIDRRAVMQLIRSIRVMGKDELHIEFNYQDEYQKAVSLAEQIAVQGKERKVG